MTSLKINYTSAQNTEAPFKIEEKTTSGQATTENKFVTGVKKIAYAGAAALARFVEMLKNIFSNLLNIATRPIKLLHGFIVKKDGEKIFVKQDLAPKQIEAPAEKTTSATETEAEPAPAEQTTSAAEAKAEPAPAEQKANATETEAEPTPAEQKIEITEAKAETAPADEEVEETPAQDEEIKSTSKGSISKKVMRCAAYIGVIGAAAATIVAVSKLVDFNLDKRPEDCKLDDHEANMKCWLREYNRLALYKLPLEIDTNVTELNDMAGGSLGTTNLR